MQPPPSRSSGSGPFRSAWPALFISGLLIQACSSTPPLVQGPTRNMPQPQLANVERNVNPGAIFQPGDPNGMAMFQTETKPRRIGDTLKIDISESLTASSKTATKTSRANAVSTKGPGGANTMSSLINEIINADASASGEDSFDGSGKSENTAKLQGKLAASVINVLPNGNLVVAGEKSISFNGQLSTLRFSGVVDPADIRTARTVSSSDVLDAKLEQVGDGLVSASNQRTWLQRFLTDKLTVW